MSTRIHPSSAVGALTAAACRRADRHWLRTQAGARGGMNEVGQASVSVDVVEARLWQAGRDR